MGAANGAIYHQRQVLPLTGLRAIGALLVLIYHFHKMEGTFLAPVVDYGGAIGVMIFFCLSGYILTHVYQADFGRKIDLATWWGFIWKRLARIYPLHLFLIAFLLVTYPHFLVAANSGPIELLQNLLLVHGWLGKFSFIEASWSISVEFFFYLLFPILLVLGKGSRATWTLVILVTAYTLILTPIYAFGAKLPGTVEWFALHRVFSYGAFFVLGICAYFAAGNPALGRLTDTNLAFAGAAFVLVAASYFDPVKFLAAAVAIPILVRATHVSGVSSRLLGNATLVLLGELSYSIYLSHQLIHQVVARMVPADLPTIWTWVMTYGLLLPWCLMCYFLVEVPARVWLRRAGPSRQKPSHRARAAGS